MTASPDQTNTNVHILMGVLNGQDMLPEQLDSIAAQRGTRWHMTVSDDGSQDGSRAVIQRFLDRRPGRVTTMNGPSRGFAKNYLTLLASLPRDSGPVALADQDDIWMPDKIARAITALGQLPAQMPALYCGSRMIWNPDRDHMMPERRGHPRPSFRNALVQNIASGNTIVLNAPAARLARLAAKGIDDVFAHDWWLYLLIAGAGGQVIYDPTPALYYRQHAGNVIGARRGIAQQVTRKRAVLRGVFRDQVAGNIAAMRRCEQWLTRENRTLLAAFDTARTGPLVARLRAIRRLGLYRQSPTDTCALWGATVLGKV